MHAVQMTLDEDLVSAVDMAASRIGLTRSAFARQALRAELRRIATQEEEVRHRKGYERKPVAEGEFSDWEDEQAWGDA